MWWTALAHAAPTPAPAAQAETAVRTACPPGTPSDPSQSFVLADPGRPWDGLLVAVGATNDALCVAYQRPGAAPKAVVHRYELCMNCSLQGIAAVGFADVNGDGVPDVSVALDAIVGWNPKGPVRFEEGRLFGAWTVAADGSALTWLERADERQAADLEEFWRILPAR